MSLEAIGAWFDSDPEAPVILCTRSPEESGEDSTIRIAINRHGVERELRARGLDESHPSWEMAVEVVGPTLRDKMAEILQGTESQVAANLRKLSAVPAAPETTLVVHSPEAPAGNRKDASGRATAKMP